MDLYISIIFAHLFKIGLRYIYGSLFSQLMSLSLPPQDYKQNINGLWRIRDFLRVNYGRKTIADYKDCRGDRVDIPMKMAQFEDISFGK